MPSAETCSIRTDPSRSTVTDRSVERKSPVAHRRDVRARVRRPRAHRVRMLARVLLHRRRRAAVGVALAQHRVHGAALDAVVARADLALLVVGRLVRVVGDRVALLLQLGDRRLELRHRRADVRQLDDVRLRRLRQLARARRARRRPAAPRAGGPGTGRGSGRPARCRAARSRPRPRRRTRARSAAATGSPAPAPRRCVCRRSSSRFGSLVHRCRSDASHGPGYTVRTTRSPRPDASCRRGDLGDEQRE